MKTGWGTLDTATTEKPVTATGQVFNFGTPLDFYLTLASYYIPGQAVGPSVTVTVFGGSDNGRQVVVAYGDVTPPQLFNGVYIFARVAASPAGAVSVRVIASSSPQEIDPGAVGIVTSSGDEEAGNSVALTVAPALIWGPCPPNAKATLLRLALAAAVGGQTITAWVTGTSRNFSFFITPAGGVGVGSGTVWTAGAEPGCSKVLAPYPILLPGDSVWGTTTNDGDSTATIELLQEPL